MPPVQPKQTSATGARRFPRPTAHAARRTGSVAFHARSQIDPWHEFEVVEMLEAEYIGGSTFFTMKNGQVVYEY